MNTSSEPGAGNDYDVAVVGGGVNGASTAETLSRAGYRVVLLEAEDFGGGASSRSTRLIHCGLRYLAGGRSLRETLSHPSRLPAAVSMARHAMLARSELRQTSPQRVHAMQLALPACRGDGYTSRQLVAAFRTLNLLAVRRAEPVRIRSVGRDDARGTPILRWFGRLDTMDRAVVFEELQANWPERLAVDSVLAAERNGATVRNYARAVGLERQRGRWRLEVTDTVTGIASSLTCSAVVNAAGPWADLVDRLAAPGAGRRVAGAKGSHLVVRLREASPSAALMHWTRDHRPFFVTPWHGLHIVGNTETPFEGDPADARVTDEEVEYLLDEARVVIPAASLSREDIVYVYAGVRPLTYTPSEPHGSRSRVVHHLSSEGAPGLFTLTGGPITTYRSAGPQVLAALRRHLAAPRPSSPRQPAAPPARPEPAGGDRLCEHCEVTVEELRAAAGEHVTHLDDLLFRRVFVGWAPCMGAHVAGAAAEAVAAVLGWDDARVSAEVERYQALLRDQFRLGEFGPVPGLAATAAGVA